LTKSKAKLRLRLSTAATFIPKVWQRMEKFQDIAWIGNLLLMISVFRKLHSFDEIVLFNRRSQGPHSADQNIRKTINMRQFIAMNQLRVIQNSLLICFVEEILIMSLILYTTIYNRQRGLFSVEPEDVL
jgi:hypothetical protein